MNSAHMHDDAMTRSTYLLRLRLQRGFSFPGTHGPHVVAASTEVSLDLGGGGVADSWGSHNILV
jgi:hypothetical protein